MLGMGFVLTPERAHTLLSQDERNAAVLFPVLGRKDFNNRPDQSPSRWVINFHDWPLYRGTEGSWNTSSPIEREQFLKSGRVPNDYPEPVAADFPECLEIIERLVKQKEPATSAKARREFWWRYAERGGSLCRSKRYEAY